ncbi:hypothetical protein ABLE92_13135 [Gordonia sp. VNQ95]|jgi:hypothetical protein|uniref:hypothetical protein n=1 Tax=Gordonia TaxID=2053 RepID=UPI0032B38563
MARLNAVVRVLAAMLVISVATVLIAACGGDAPTRPGLPADFPTAQVPLVDGQVLTADGSKDHWTVTVQAPANQGNPIEGAVTKLTDAGFTEEGRESDSGQTVVRMSGTKDGTTYWVTLGITPAAAAGATSVFYQVSVG